MFRVPLLCRVYLNYIRLTLQYSTASYAFGTLVQESGAMGRFLYSLAVEHAHRYMLKGRASSIAYTTCWLRTRSANHVKVAKSLGRWCCWRTIVKTA
jgi:hypothetical protein